MRIFKEYIFRRKEKKRKEAELKNVGSQLPDFINRLVLLLNAGMVLTSAIEKIIEEEEGDSFFYLEIKGIYERMERINVSFGNEFREFAIRAGSRELLRLSNIINDNINMGSELTEKLEQEAAFMWSMSKKQAEEQGRLAESKMTFPMALMLITIIVVTVAPALMGL